MTAKVRFDYFTAATGSFIKSEFEDVSFRNINELETLIEVDSRIRGKKYNDDVVGHVMEIHS